MLKIVLTPIFIGLFALQAVLYAGKCIFTAFKDILKFLSNELTFFLESQMELAAFLAMNKDDSLFKNMAFTVFIPIFLHVGLGLIVLINALNIGQFLPRTIESILDLEIQTLDYFMKRLHGVFESKAPARYPKLSLLPANLEEPVFAKGSFSKANLE